MVDKKIQILEDLIVDLIDGGLLTRWDQIRSETGLSEDRCKEMEKLINEIHKEYNERNSKEI